MEKLLNLEYFKDLINGKATTNVDLPFIYPPTIAHLIGFQLTDIGEGTVCFELQTDVKRHANPLGTIHGGILCDLGDAAIGFAHMTTLYKGESCTSVDLQINFFRPLWSEKIRAHSKPIHIGKTISRYVCDITKEDGKLVAQVTSSVMTLRDKQAEGR